MTKEEMEEIRLWLPGAADGLAERLAREGIGMLIEAGQSLDDVGDVRVTSVLETAAGPVTVYMGIEGGEGEAQAAAEDGGRHPNQPLLVDGGVVRFKPNKIVEWLFEEGLLDLNRTAAMGRFPREDHCQIAQLLGYSVSGYGDLSYVTEEEAGLADRAARLAAKSARGEG